MTLPTARKVANSLGMFGPAIGLIWLSWVGCDKVYFFMYMMSELIATCLLHPKIQAVVVLCLILASNAGVYSGLMVRKQSD